MERLCPTDLLAWLSYLPSDFARLSLRSAGSLRTNSSTLCSSSTYALSVWDAIPESSADKHESDSADTHPVQSRRLVCYVTVQEKIFCFFKFVKTLCETFVRCLRAKLSGNPNWEWRSWAKQHWVTRSHHPPPPQPPHPNPTTHLTPPPDGTISGGWKKTANDMILHGGIFIVIIQIKFHKCFLVQCKGIQWSSTGSDNGLTPNWRQAIKWTNHGQDPWYHNTVHQHVYSLSK